ncbi:hypothetical protein GCM10012275_54000 [Longimycelium tulufanense]|uniref:Integral membrane protein n=1 Tax=Longimycelium tulufanense TaxID=907463 RepID=A0A8J3CH40_9PSEU|nr:SCO6880 family protein [Longimycelium tulufanense]GGM76418.1 hypothetical protein GCM10012275_54000 [Longimycelium tulufanense]
MTTPRIYRGLAHREHAGWLMGLTAPQAIACVLLAVPAVLALSAGQLRQAALAVVLGGLGIALVVVPVAGRPAARWVGHWLAHRLGTVTGWSAWQSRAAAGECVTLDEPDLPGTLARLSFVDGPVYKDRGRLCLVHDTVEGRWTAVARLTHRGVGLTSDEDRLLLAARLGTLLRAAGHREVLDRLSIYVRTVPDDGAEYEAWRAAHQVPDAPALAVAATEELRRTTAVACVRHELFLAASASEDALRKPAAAAGGGIAGRAHALYRALDGLEDQLRGLDCTSITWLDGPALAEAIRTGFNPLAPRRPDEVDGVPWAKAGPSTAPPPAVRSYTHDGHTSVTYSIQMPDEGVLFGSLAPLLAVKTPGERRALAVHYEPLDARATRRAVRGDRQRMTVLRDLKARKGFAVTATDDRAAQEAHAHERAVAAGHSIVRLAAAVTVTVPVGWDVEDAAAGVENDAAGRFQLLRLELAQDSALVAAAIPVGIGLPRLRGGLL